MLQFVYLDFSVELVVEDVLGIYINICYFGFYNGVWEVNYGCL